MQTRQGGVPPENELVDACVILMTRCTTSNSLMYVDDDGNINAVLYVGGPVDDEYSFECMTPCGRHVKRADIMLERLLFDWHISPENPAIT